MARRRIGLLWFTAATAAVVSSGCAKSPAGAGRGTRLIVTVQFQDPVKLVSNYFFVIRNWGDPAGKNGPVPPAGSPFGGNGFATEATPGNGPAFTDFVAFGGGGYWSGSSSGYTLWHVPKDKTTGQFNPATSSFILRGEPITATPPNGGHVLQFELDLSQIAPSSDDPVPSPDQRPRYLQVNLIATTTLPANQISDPTYVVDAMGDQSSPNSGSFNAFLQIDTTQARTYTSHDPVTNQQEREGDTWSLAGRTDPSVDLVSWSIQVVGG